MSWSVVKENLKKMLSLGYLTLIICIAVLFFVCMVILTNRATVVSFFASQGTIPTISLIRALTVGFHTTVTISHYLATLLISLLAGLVIALFVIRKKTHQELSGKTGLLSTIGASIGILAPGCAACSLGILPLLGFSSGSALALLPLGGLEISILSIGLLGFSAWKLAAFEPTCEIKKK